MIRSISIKSLKVNKFLNNICDDFAENKSIKNSPWKYNNLKNFKFFFYIFRNEVIGTIVISNHRMNTHINFLYILKKFRKKTVGKKLIKFIESTCKKKTISVHVFKYAKKVKLFYQKNGFQEFNDCQELKEFITKAKRFNKNVYNEKKLLFKKITI